jgi:hypothetical protein
VCSFGEHCNAFFDYRLHDSFSYNSSPSKIDLTLFHWLPIMDPLHKAEAQADSLLLAMVKVGRDPMFPVKM